jgi:spermidine synthase
LNRASRFPLLAYLAIIAAMMISGASGLAYEVVWSRMLVVPLGNSADANALVLAAFMLGIALGARFLGAPADRRSSPLRYYALLELLLGVLALFMPALLGEIDTLSSRIVPSGNVMLLDIARLAIAGALVAIPSLAMGATVPVLVRGLSEISTDVRYRIGIVYGSNTLGACAGACAAGFWGIPLLGLQVTATVAAMGSFIAAVVVFAADSLMAISKPKVGGAPRNSVDPEQTPGRLAATAALAAAAVSGLAMLAAEVLWGRVLSFVFGADTYAFAVLLAVVLAGIGLGGFVYRLFVRLNPLGLLAALTGLFPLTLLLAYWVAASIVIRAGRDPFDIGSLGGLSGSAWLEFFRQVAYAPVLVFVPSLVAGMTFSAACAVYAGPASESGLRVGRVILWNGFGSVVGALAASFGLVPLFGIQASFVIIAGLCVGVSLYTVLAAVRTQESRGAWFCSVPAALAVATALFLPADLPKAMLMEAVGAKHQRLVYYDEARAGTISVTENTINGEKQLFINAVNEVSTRLVHDQSFKVLGHLGPLLHPHPRSGLMICLGAGISTGAALTHPFLSLDVVELSPAIPGAARLWQEENNHVLDDPRLHLHIGDGRHFLERNPKQFDVIMIDSTHPKAVDSWLLYTEQFYRLVSSRLAEQGIAVQWVPLHGLSEREFKVIVRTFQSVFSHVSLWVNVGFETYGQAAYAKLVGRMQPLEIDYNELSRRLKEPRIGRDLEPFGLHTPEAILDGFIAGQGELTKWTQGLPTQTDDKPMVPFITPLSAGRRMEAPILLGVRSSVWPYVYRLGEDRASFFKRLMEATEAAGFLLAGKLDRAGQAWPGSPKIALFEERFGESRDYYLALAERYANKPAKIFEIGSYLGNLGFLEEANRLYRVALNKDPGDRRTRLNLALVLLDQGDPEGAEEILNKLVSEAPDVALYRFNLGVVLGASGDRGGALKQLVQAVALAPGLIPAQIALADAMLGLGRLDEAESALKKVLVQNRWIAEVWEMLGLVSAARGNWNEAKAHHVRAARLEPYRATAHYNLGIVLQETGRLVEAAEAYRAALSIEPRDAEAANNLGLVYAAAGLFDRARDAHAMAIEIEPNYPAAFYNLGLAEKELGSRRAAGEAFRKALALDPDLTMADEQLKSLGLDSSK